MHSHKLHSSDQQALASNPKYNVYLSANAGTGKTKVLVDRFINLLLSGAKPQNILCITFTKNAAHEITERIVAEITKIRDTEPIIYNNFIDSLPSLKIQTLHSFCHELLSEYSQNEIAIISEEQKRKITEDAWRVVSSTASSELREGLALLLKYITPFSIKDKLKEARAKYRKNIIAPSAPQFYDFEKDVQALVDGTPLAGKDSAYIVNTLLTQNHEKRKRLADKELYYLQDPLLFLLERQKEYLSDAINNTLQELLTLLAKEIDHAKSLKGVYEFSDLLTKVIELIYEDPEILYKLNYRIDHILVDEAQDLSEEQWQLIDILSEEFFSGADFRNQNRTIFIVGDFKQSIYGFQGARPDIFVAIKDHFKGKVTAAQKDWIELDLYISYRSHNNILTFIDATFKDLYSNWVEHISHKGDGGIVSKWYAPTYLSEKTSGWHIPSKDAHQITRDEHLAADLVNRIKELTNRVPPSDIMIIFRKRSSFASQVVRELYKNNLRATDLTSDLMSDLLIYQDIASIIHFYLYQDDDLNLAALLKSPIFNFTDEMLTLLAEADGTTLFDKLAAYSKDTHQALISIQTTLSSRSKIHSLASILNQHISHYTQAFGSSAVESINYFIKMVGDYFQSENACWLAFLKYYREARLAVSEHNENAIKLMTAHGSKGLQSRIVILADAYKCVRAHDQVILTEELAFIPPVDIRSQKYFDIARKHKDAILAEERLLLYVALSRAESELYIYMGDKYDTNSWSSYLEDIETQDTPYEPKQSTSTQKTGLLTIDHNYSTHNVDKVSYSKTDFIDHQILYGKLIHEILYYRAILSDSDYYVYIDSLHKLKNGLFTYDDVLKGINEATEVINKHQYLFGSNTVSELGLLHEGAELRIDKLVVYESRIEIIDFKTDRTPKANQIPKNYVEQLHKYHMAIQNLYPSHSITCHILWTSNASLSSNYIQSKQAKCS